MKIYTKILIGMVFGAVVGLVFGPQSSWLKKDVYIVKSVEGLTLAKDKDDPEATRLTLPKNVSDLRLQVLETTTTTLQDNDGNDYQFPTWARVRFEYTKKMKLADEAHNALGQLFGQLKVGGQIEAWLQIKPLSAELPSGRKMPALMPVSSVGATVTEWMEPIGDLFMRLLKMVIVPLVFTSLVVGVASLGDMRRLGRLGGRTMGIYFLTTAVAVSIGLGAAHLISPGDYVPAEQQIALKAQFKGDAGGKARAASESKDAMDNVLEIVPTNPVASLAKEGSNLNMLQVIFFAIIFGVALTLIDESKALPVIEVLDGVMQAMIVVIHIVMALAPYGVAALLAVAVGNSGWGILQALFVYGLTVILGLTVQLLLVYGGLIRFVAKLPFLSFLRACRPAQLIAFSTSSSSATLPVSMECAQENLGISKSVSSFVLPLGSTINMDGTALYQGVAAIFIAQVMGIDLDFVAQLGIVLTATAASIGAAGVPGAGMVTLAIVLVGAGVPMEGVALILGVDRLLDMFRTALNVTGDLAVATTMAVSEGEKIEILSAEADEKNSSRGFESRLDKHERKIDPDT